LAALGGKESVICQRPPPVFLAPCATNGAVILRDMLIIRIVPTHSGFEQVSNDYQRLERRWPASTGWLIVSVLFANKLWIMDVTSMSLYWVARLPIKRPREQTYLLPMRRPERAVLATAAPNGSRGRQWKIALSLAIVGALAAPFLFRTYKARPIHSVWVPLTAREKKTSQSLFKTLTIAGGSLPGPTLLEMAQRLAALYGQTKVQVSLNSDMIAFTSWRWRKSYSLVGLTCVVSNSDYTLSKIQIQRVGGGLRLCSNRSV
jgi:hypothetical protein